MKYTRPLLLAASALALFISACSQPADIQAPDLTAQFGTANDDIGVDVAVPSVDRVYVLSDQSGPFCDESAVQRVLLRRYDGRGTLVWNNQVTSLPNDYDCTDLRARVLGADAQGNTYALVSQKGDTGDVRRYAHYDLYKYDVTGKFIKKVDIGSNYWDFGADAEHENAIDMAVDSSGNIYMAYEAGFYDFESDSVTKANLVVKYATTGVKQWQRVSTVGLPYGITVSSSGSVYVVGTKGLARYTNSGDLTWSKAADNSKGLLSGDVVVSGSSIYTRSVRDIRKYDGSGRQLWLKTQAGLNTIVVQDMSGDGNGNLYLSGKYEASAGNFSAFARKLNSSGSALWTRTYGTPEYDDARGIATLSGSEVYVTGETQGSLAHPNRGGYENRDGYLRKLSSSGNPLWTR